MPKSKTTNKNKSLDNEAYEEVPVMELTEDYKTLRPDKNHVIKNSIDVVTVDKEKTNNPEYYNVAFDKEKQEELRRKLGIDIKPSYFNKNILDNAILSRTKYDANSFYKRTRRLNTPSQRLRIGPVYATNDSQNPSITQKPGKIRITEGDQFGSNHAIGMLAYFQAICNRIELCEIDLNFIKSMIDAGVDLNRKDEYGQTVLYAAVRDWHHEVSQFLIDHGADVNSCDDFGRTPLHLAAALNCVNITRVLLRAGANPNTPTYKEYQTPLHFAAKHDSEEVLKELLVSGGTFITKDRFGRTPLFVAAHRGCDKTSRYLLESGAPCFVTDANGDSIISGLVEKLPNVAASGLDQFILKGEKTTRLSLYLAQLENIDVHNTKQKSILELITLYRDRELLMHPIIQKSIEIKWQLFGKRRSILELVLVIVHMAIWFALVYTQRDSIQYYTNKDGIWHYDEWRIILEILVVLFSLLFFFRNMFDLPKMRIERQQWKEERRREIKRNYIYCHPAWPEERSLMARNEEAIDQLPNGNGRVLRWFIYETVTLVLIVLTIFTRVLALVYPSSWRLFLGHKVMLGATAFFSSIRALKVLSTFPYLAELFCACSYLGKPLLQSTVLFLQFFIPFVALCFNWFFVTRDEPSTSQNTTIVNFNTSSNTTSKQNEQIVVKDMSQLFALFGALFRLMYNHHIKIGVDDEDRTEANAFLSLFQLFSFIFNAFLIAIITSRFTMVFGKARAEASLLRAEYLVKLQKELKDVDKEKVSLYYKSYCNPMAYNNREARLKLTLRDLKTMFTILKTKLDLVSRDLEDIERHSMRSILKPAIFTYHSIVVNATSLQNNLTDLKTSFTKDMAKLMNIYQLLPNNIEAIKKLKE